MAETKYQDLREFGLPLVPAGDLRFGDLVRDIEERSQPVWLWPEGDLDPAAVLLNECGRAIVALSYVWRYTNAEGKVRTSICSNLGSSMQMEVLSGQDPVTRDLGSFILAGSKRLITEEGTFGNNLDVLPEGFGGRSGVYMGGGGGGGGYREHATEGIERIELCLDLAVLEDGLCAGPDEGGLFESLTRDLERQQTTAQETAESLRKGASAGQIFELLLPLARHTPPADDADKPGRNRSRLLKTFATMAIHHLMHAEESELMVWLDRAAQATPLRLHRPA